MSVAAGEKFSQKEKAAAKAADRKRAMLEASKEHMRIVQIKSGKRHSLGKSAQTCCEGMEYVLKLATDQEAKTKRTSC